MAVIPRLDRGIQNPECFRDWMPAYPEGFRDGHDGQETMTTYECPFNSKTLNYINMES